MKYLLPILIIAINICYGQNKVNPIPAGKIKNALGSAIHWKCPVWNTRDTASKQVDFWVYCDTTTWDTPIGKSKTLEWRTNVPPVNSIFGIDTAYKTYIEYSRHLYADTFSIEPDTFQVRYIIDRSTSFTPLIGIINGTDNDYARMAHYGAQIQVYRISDGKRIPIGKKITGTYGPACCDRPDDWIGQAKNQTK